MTVWDEVREALSRLLADRPGFDQVDAGPPPYRVGLEAWAEDAAAGLYRQFGGRVELTVGALPYPPGRARGRGRAAAPLLGPDEGEAELDGAAVVRSGRTLHHGLLVRDRSGGGLAIAANGQVTASVVDPATGAVVGGFAGWQTAPLLVFRVPPGGTERIPLLIGTASTDERLGYAVPPGEWGIQATLSLMADAERSDGRERVRRRTPVFPLTIAAR